MFLKRFVWFDIVCLIEDYIVVVWRIVCFRKGEYCVVEKKGFCIVVKYGVVDEEGFLIVIFRFG